MDVCSLCAGEKKDSTTTYSVDLGFGVVVVRNVPAKICSQCGEEWIEHKVAKNLEIIVKKARASHCQLEVIPFEPTFPT